MATCSDTGKRAKPRRQTTAPKASPKISETRKNDVWKALPGLPGVAFWRQRLLVPLTEPTFTPLNRLSDPRRANEISEALRLLVAAGYGKLTHVQTEIPGRSICCVVTVPEFWEWLQDSASPSSLANGPVGSDGFRWDCREYHGLPPRAHRLLCVLWSTRGHAAVLDDLKEPVWEDRAARLSPDMVGSVRRELNRFLGRNAIPFKVTIQRDRVALRRVQQ